MNTKNNVVDVSSSLLFEASADSAETQQERDHNGNDDQGYEDYDDDGDDDDDESTCQSTSGSTGFELVEKDEEEEVVAGEEENHDDGDGEVSSYRRWSEGKDSEIVTVDSSSTRNDERLVREMEKNRMFWEACLAS